MDPASQGQLPKTAIMQFNGCQSAAAMAAWNLKYTPWVFDCGKSREVVLADLTAQYQQDIQKYAASLATTQKTFKPVEDDEIEKPEQK